MKTLKAELDTKESLYKLTENKHFKETETENQKSSKTQIPHFSFIPTQIKAV